LWVRSGTARGAHLLDRAPRAVFPRAPLSANHEAIDKQHDDRADHGADQPWSKQDVKKMK
jgi:hypothetical protein